jgi:uncharacterized protein involved in high-affinity Fe2+ transport
MQRLLHAAPETPMKRLVSTLALALALSAPAAAREYYVGGPVHVNDMEIVANYLVGVTMTGAPGHQHHTAAGPDVIHLEADVHATADNAHGYQDAAWIPYLTVEYTVEKTGSPWRASGTLVPMIAKDGPHYADNVKMDGPGEYKVTYRFSPPEVNGFLRHTDEETGVPAWWAPFAQDFTFKYPQQ